MQTRAVSFFAGALAVATLAALALADEPLAIYHHQLYPMLPDPTLTPGAVSETRASVICQPGYARAHRPDADLSHTLKLASLDRYHVPRQQIGAVELDALIPICLGGDHYSQKNLWPQPWSGQWNARVKDELERRVCREDCESGDDAKIARDQLLFATNWIGLWKERMR